MGGRAEQQLVGRDSLSVRLWRVDRRNHAWRMETGRGGGSAGTATGGRGVFSAEVRGRVAFGACDRPGSYTALLSNREKVGYEPSVVQTTRLDFGLVVQTTFTGGPNHEIENLVNP